MTGGAHLISSSDPTGTNAYRCRLQPKVGRHIHTDDVIDAQGMADLLGLAQRNTVSLYQRRYPAMPRPVIDLGQGRCKLWLRSEVDKWQSERLSRSDPA